MFGPPRIDGNKLDDHITGHGGQDQFDGEPDDDPNDQDATPIEPPDHADREHDSGGGPVAGPNTERIDIAAVHRALAETGEVYGAD